TLKVSLVIVLGLAIARLLAGWSAAVRHWVLSVTMLCALSTPLLERIVPTWGPRPSAFASAADDFIAGTTLQPGTVTERIELIQISGARPAPARIDSLLGAILAPAWLLGVGLSLLVLAIGLARLAWLASRARRVDS